MGLGVKPEWNASNRAAVLASGIIGLNFNMIIGFASVYPLGFSFAESPIIAAATYISSTAMSLTSLIEKRKIMLRKSDTVILLMVFEDLVLILILAFLSVENQNRIIFFVKIISELRVLYVLTQYSKEFFVSILDRDDELFLIITCAAVLTTASLSIYLGVPETMMVIALGVAFATTDPHAFEQHARPLKDVFLVVFFVFFGVTVDFLCGANWFVVGAISIIAVASKLISGLQAGIFIHGSALSGFEIWANAIALAVLYGPPVVGTTNRRNSVRDVHCGLFHGKIKRHSAEWDRKPQPAQGISAPNSLKQRTSDGG
ncbi:MAG: cation:proton antiporter [Methanomicrobiales archaeon]